MMTEVISNQSIDVLLLSILLNRFSLYFILSKLLTWHASLKLYRAFSVDNKHVAIVKKKDEHASFSSLISIYP